MTVKRVLKKLIPPGKRLRVLPLGIGRGLSMRLDLREGWIGTYLGFYEIELNGEIRRLCLPGFRSFDVGGQIGYDALVLAKLSGAEVLTVEALPDCCEEIRANALANWAIGGRLTILNAYATDTAESAAAEVESVTIDQLAARFFTPDFIKMDIEGGEVAALRGAARTLGELQPNLLIEVHSLALENDCLDLLRAYGYQPRLIDQRRFLREHRPTAHNRWIVATGRSAPSSRGPDAG